MNAAGLGHGGGSALEPSKLRVCLAASGGGHLRQLIDLEATWSRHHYFFVTEDTALGQSLATRHRVHFVPHFGWGQVKLGKALRMLNGALKSFFISASVILRERPQVVISTGAAAVFFTVVWARLLGAHIVTIESFARFERASLFGRMTKSMAHDMVVQSQQLALHYPQAEFFDPLKVLDRPVAPKRDLLFATVGAVLPFDRLVAAVADVRKMGATSDEIVIQTGVGGLKPEGLNVVETMPFEDIQNLLRDASVVVCHGGTGSIITALREGCHVIVMPRLERLGEVYDDHQAEITDAFVKRGLVQTAVDADSLATALKATHGRKRVVATTEPVALAGFLDDVIDGVARRKKRP